MDMQTNCSVKRAGVVLLCVMGACVAIVSLSGSAFGSGLSAALPVNESGLSYGTIFQSEEAGQPVDLIEVQATNGSIGYVYSNELEEAETHGITTPGEAEKVMGEIEEASEEALAKRLTQLLPEEREVSPETAAEYLEITIRQPADEIPVGLISQEELNGIECLAESTGLEKEDVLSVLDEALACAEKDVQVKIPVYEKDGKTQIGEFAVGSLA